MRHRFVEEDGTPRAINPFPAVDSPRALSEVAGALTVGRPKNVSRAAVEVQNQYVSQDQSSAAGGN